MGETLLNSEPSSYQEGEVKTGQTPPDPAPVHGSVVIPENWKEAIPEDIRGADVFKMIPDVPTMAKNYFHAQKAIGADKVVVPSKHATADDWKGVFNKLGLPENVDKYEVNVDSDSIDEEFLGEFKTKAFESNILPHQAQAMLDWYVERSGQMLGAQQKQSQREIEAAVGELQKEYGSAFVQNIEVAKNVLKEVGGEDLASKITNSVAGSDPNVVRLLVKIGEILKDDPIKGEAVHGLGAMTPAEAMAEMAKLRGDKAFLDKEHAGHTNAVAEMNRLASVAYPE